MEISVGKKGRFSSVVTPENTAAAVGSGLLPVFSTPMMIAMMEHAAVNALADCLHEGEGSVGTHMDVSHDSATPVGMQVWAEAEITEVNGRAITFAVSAFDEAGLIGKGVHQRFLIANERFLAKAQRKIGKETGKN